MRRIIASLDIGTNNLKLVIGEYFKNKLNILAVVEHPSKGLKKGIVTQPEALVGSLRELFNKANDVVGLEIKKVILSISSKNADVVICEGQTNVINDNKIITEADLDRVLQSSIHSKMQDDRTVISATPTIYRINDDNLVANPLNMQSNKIAVKSVMCDVPNSNVDPIRKCLKHLGIEVSGMYLSTVGDYYSIKNKNMDSNSGIVVNIGASTTTLSSFNKGVLTNTITLDLGGDNVDRDIEFIYKITNNEAKKLKEKLSLAHNRFAEASESVEVTNKLGEAIKINQYEISEIVMYRLAEILNLVKKQINHLTKKKISYIMFVGGVTETTDFDIILEEVFGKSVTIGSIKEIGVRNNKYSSAVGLIKSYNNDLKKKNIDYSLFSIEEQEEFSGFNNNNVSQNSVLGKLFGYFFDN
ncbi:MAG: cell division protein FtsA [Bacilli bacterium]|nr:cell division protein FtsA [Bacilli bacterium]